ncbi:hypothetical protein N9I13_00120 [bacterium]|jgi:hypothetical protein|nr:hypothetical protein [bacterium]|tara:strand:+ start:35 stop:238 length:204 start_codon:yes stop_codon:yes gene_type:complete
MNLDQIANKYGVNRNSLNAKDDAVKIAIKSIQDIVQAMEAQKVDVKFIDGIKKLGNFLHDVKNSTMG